MHNFQRMQLLLAASLARTNFGGAVQHRTVDVLSVDVLQSMTM